MPFCHVSSENLITNGAAGWLRGAAAVNLALPLALARDIGLLLTVPVSQLKIEKPAYLPFDEDMTHYLNFLEWFSRHPLTRELCRWQPGISDAVAAVIVARLIEGVELPDTYRVPTGPAGVVFMRALANELESAEPAQVWHDTPLDERPQWSKLLPPEALACIESNLQGLDREELRFLVRYGPPLSGSPDPRDLLDMLSLTDLPEVTRLAVSQTIKLLPRISSIQTVGGIQTYPEGGYEGLSRKGSLDSLLLTELAYPEDIFLHRIFNNEALYYGRQRPRERRRELAYIVTQLGWGLGGDGQVLARALLLALAQAMQRRGYDVFYSFAGNDLTEPETLVKPGEVGRMLHYQINAKTDEETVLNNVLKHLKSWREVYQGRQVLLVMSEFFDSDDFDEHNALYHKLNSEAGQQAWFIHVGSDTYKRQPAAARFFKSWHMLHTSMMREENVK